MSIYQNVGQYVIARDRQVLDADAPWEGLKFSVPDHLYEKLKEMYPHLESHSSRKLRALIDFLCDELSKQGNVLVVCRVYDKTGECTDFPQGTVESNFQLSDSEYVTATESEGNPSISASPTPGPTSPNISSSHGGKPLAPQTALEPPNVFPGKMVPQISVFNLSDGKEVKQKKKRRMNAAERAQYKDRRKVGACERCRGAKKKCICKSVSCVSTQELSMATKPDSSRKRKLSSTQVDETRPTAQKLQKLEVQSDIPSHGTPPAIIEDLPSATLPVSHTTVSPGNPDAATGNGSWGQNLGQLISDHPWYDYSVLLPNQGGQPPSIPIPEDTQGSPPDFGNYPMPGSDISNYVQPSALETSSPTRARFSYPFHPGISQTSSFPMPAGDYQDPYHNNPGNP